MSNVWIVTLWLVVSTAPAMAAEAPDLNFALKKYKNLETLEVDFEQVKTLSDMDFKLKSQGHMSVRLPSQVTWEIFKPAPLKFELDTEDSNSPIPEKQRQEIAQMIQWLKLDPEALAESYEVTSEKANNFTFTPKVKTGIFKSMHLTMKNGYADQLLLVEVSGDQMSLKFAKPILKYKK